MAAAYDLLLIDELGYLSFDSRGADLLYQVLNKRWVLPTIAPSAIETPRFPAIVSTDTGSHRGPPTFAARQPSIEARSVSVARTRHPSASDVLSSTHNSARNVVRLETTVVCCATTFTDSAMICAWAAMPFAHWLATFASFLPTFDRLSACFIRLLTTFAPSRCREARSSRVEAR
jgi:hypothetical protein